MSRVAILASAPAVRAGLRLLLNGDGVQVVGEAASVAGLAPPFPEFDLLLIVGGWPASELARYLPDECALLLLGNPSDDFEALDTLPVTAWGLLPLDASEPMLRAAIALLHEGLSVLPPALATRALSQSASGEELVEPLTPRELEVLQQVSYGLTNREIARALGISDHTVKFHLSTIFGKLGASSRTDAVSRGARLGLIVL